MSIQDRLAKLRETLRISSKKERISEIEKEMLSPVFWADDKKAAALTVELKSTKEEVDQFESLENLSELADEEDLGFIGKELEKLETVNLFSGKYDEQGAIINFYAGAGGDDAQDWTEMLLRMYLRWSENNNIKTTILAESKGAEAGIKSATVEFKGRYAYGKLHGESGVHRLVRQSPFNAKNLRQTSFALVEVLPEVESDSEVKIDPSDLRIDVFRSGGHGGQSVNTTDSAVRITHLPTGIVVTCQNERSQLQNKETAMTILRSRLTKLMADQHKERIEELKGDFSSPKWGNQIRSYVLHPYKLVKDHRTQYESKNPDQVLDGEIDGFIEAELKRESEKGGENEDSTGKNS